MNPKMFLIASGILLFIAVALPWAIVTSDFLGVTHPVMGYESDDGIFTGTGGLLLLFIGLFAKEKPGKIFSVWGLIVTSVCGLIFAYKLFTVLTYVPASDITISLGSGLSIFTPLGIVLGFLGSIFRRADKTIPGSLPSTSTESVSTETPLESNSSEPTS